MAVPPHTPEGAPPRDIQVEEKSTNWLAWLLLLAGLIALLWWLFSRDHDVDRAAVGTQAATTDTGMTGADNAMIVDNGMAADTTGVTDPNAISEGIDRPLSQLPNYVAGTDPTPATFTFERLNFDTDSTKIKAGDEAEVRSIAAALKNRGTARIKVTGYADPRGTKPYNQRLATERADAVKQALVAQGVAADRIETEGGGETMPANAGSVQQARAEARRAQITLLSR